MRRLSWNRTAFVCAPSLLEDDQDKAYGRRLLEEVETWLRSMGLSANRDGGLWSRTKCLLRSLLDLIGMMDDKALFWFLLAQTISAMTASFRCDGTRNLHVGESHTIWCLTRALTSCAAATHLTSQRKTPTFSTIGGRNHHVCLNLPLRWSRAFPAALDQRLSTPMWRQSKPSAPVSFWCGSPRVLLKCNMATCRQHTSDDGLQSLCEILLTVPDGAIE